MRKLRKTMALFEMTCKRGEVFEFEGKYFVAEQDSAWQNVDDLEDGFDIFLPRSGNYVQAHEATTEQAEAYKAKQEAERQARLNVLFAGSGTFKAGQQIRWKKSGKIGHVVSVSDDGDMLLVHRDDFAKDFKISCGVVEAI